MSESDKRPRDPAGRGRPAQGMARPAGQPAGRARVDDPVRQRRRAGGEPARARQISLRAAGHGDPMGACRSADRARAGRRRHRALIRPGLAAITTRLAQRAVGRATNCWCPTASTARPASSATPSSSAIGVTTRYYDPLVGAGIAELIGEKTRAILLESPGSLTMEVQDVPGDLRRRARARHRHADRQHLGDAAALSRRSPPASTSRSSPRPNMSAAMPTSCSARSTATEQHFRRIQRPAWDLGHSRLARRRLARLARPADHGGAAEAA